MFGPPQRWSVASRRLVGLFLVVLVPPAAALVALGLMVLEQDRRLAAQREIEERESATDSVVRSLTGSLAAARAASDRGEPVQGAALLRRTADRVIAAPTGALAWTPTPERLTEADERPFADAEILEYQHRGDRGASIYSEHAAASLPAVRAAALLRLARVHRTSGRMDIALRVYADLAVITTVAFEGMPADLMARRATCEILEKTGRRDQLAAAAASLARDLLAGQWSLDESAWQLTTEQLTRWTGRPFQDAADRASLSSAADWLWRAGRREADELLAPTGQRTIVTGDTSTVLAWTTVASEVRALAVTADVASRWTRHAREAARLPSAEIALLSESGRPIVGQASTPDMPSSRRAAIETGLPWTVVVHASSSPSSFVDLRTRRAMLIAGLGAVVILIAGGGILIWRVVQRELVIARQHTDFVAAVSHEFRTPLTSLQHVAELLEEDDALPAERRRSLYRVIGRSTARLGGLVESLLDFARMEDGRKPYDLQPLDAGALAARIVQDFTHHREPASVRVRTSVDQGDMTVYGDQAALGHALWNLLENAVNYSGIDQPVDVSVERAPRGIVIAVRDEGPGIPREEQRDIFRKFVRGSDATRLGVKGTGLGLAMVSHIVDAHRGRIELESALGRGSTFRIVLPAAA